MGEIIFWTIIRTAISIIALWILNDYLDPNFWWSLFVVTVGGIIIYPATVKYRIFLENNKEVIENSLCSSCEFFDESAVLCLKHDEQPTKDYLPCDGLDWQAKP